MLFQGSYLDANAVDAVSVHGAVGTSGPAAAASDAVDGSSQPY